MQNRSISMPSVREAPADDQTTSRRREPLGGQLQLPPGFRFYPSDEELVVHYLCKRASSQPSFPTPIIAELDLYKFDPWELPGKALFGEKEWYFFSPRDRKYPNGSRPNRAAGSGYWKATGTDKPIHSSVGDGGKKKVGVKKALVFYRGRPPRGDKTNWIMHEYRLADAAAKAARRKGSIRLDDWVLCRIYNKLPSTARLAMQKEDEGIAYEEAGELEGPQHMNPQAPVAEEPTTYATSAFSQDVLRSSRNSTNFTYLDNHYRPSQEQLQMLIQSARTEGKFCDNRPFVKPPHPAYSFCCTDPSFLTSSVSPRMHQPTNSPNAQAQKFSHINTIPATHKPSSISNEPSPKIPYLKVPHLLTAANPIVVATHDSPLSSSVDEEQGQPIEKLQGQFTNKSRGEPMTSFNFDVLPSPFGQLDHRLSF